MTTADHVTRPPAGPYGGRSDNNRRCRMSFLKRLFSSKPPETTQRVRICVECGMPVAEHREWCSILRGHAEMERRKAQKE